MKVPHFYPGDPPSTTFRLRPSYISWKLSYLTFSYEVVWTPQTSFEFNPYIVLSIFSLLTCGLSSILAVVNYVGWCQRFTLKLRRLRSEVYFTSTFEVFQFIQINLLRPYSIGYWDRRKVQGILWSPVIPRSHESKFSYPIISGIHGKDGTLHPLEV